MNLIYRGRLNLPLLFVSVFISVYLSACAGQVGRAGDRLGRLERDISDLRSFQAEQTSQINALQENLRALSGRVEQLEYGQERKIGGDLTKLQEDLSSLKRRVPPPPIVPIAELEADESRLSNSENEAGRFLYNALTSLREGKFDSARSMASEAEASGRSTEILPLALFWQGVANEGLGDNKQALKAYYELSSSYPKHTRAALSLYRQGSVLIRLGDSATARLTYQKLMAEYPKSNEAQAAKDRIKDLKR